MLMQSLTEFFTHPDHMAQFQELTKKGAPISLRVIDWFVTNYSKDKDVAYRRGTDWSNGSGSGKVAGGNGDTSASASCADALGANTTVNVHESYKSQLKAYSKRQFDPFCRRDRINFFYTPNTSIETTVGQLNFFRWAIENNVAEYVSAHLSDVEAEMRVYVRAQREARRKMAKKTKSGMGMGMGMDTSGLVGGGGGGVGKTRRRVPLASSSTKTSSVSRRNIFTTRQKVTVSFG